MNDFSLQSSELFANGLYCAECVLKAFCKVEGIDSPLIPKIATGFCSGVSRTFGMCGALSGGIMALGLLYGRNESTDYHSEIYSRVQELVSEFERIFGTSNCFELINCDLNTIEGQKKFVIEDLEETVCKKTIEQVPQFIQQMVDKKP